jgi:hypothetical protein
LDDPTGARGHGSSVALAPDSISPSGVRRAMNATPVQSRMMRPSRLPESNATKRVDRVPRRVLGRASIGAAPGLRLVIKLSTSLRAERSNPGTAAQQGRLDCFRLR